MALGEKLCNARLARKQSVSNVATATRMKAQVIEAIEKEDFRRIAAPIYAKGFIRLYAEHVGLDPAPLIEEYMERFAGTARRPASRLEDGQPRIAKILEKPAQSKATEEAEAAAAAAPDLFETAPPAPEMGAPQVPPFEKSSSRRHTLPSFRPPEALRGALASATAAVAHAVGRLRHAPDLRLPAAGLLKSIRVRIAVAVAAVAIVVFAASAMTRCSRPAPSAQQPSGAAAEPIELAVEPPPAYAD